MIYEVILDSGETANKCTIAPLAYRSDFRLYRVKGEDTLGPLASEILLHPEGPCLTEIKKSVQVKGIATIDCVWRRVDPIIRRVAAPLPMLARIPDGFQTAYPRHSKHGFDPDCGLATIEAIFVARALLGVWDVTLLSHYHFGPEFVDLNAKRFLDLGVHQAVDPEARPIRLPKDRNSQQRRRDRRALVT